MERGDDKFWESFFNTDEYKEWIKDNPPSRELYIHPEDEKIWGKEECERIRNFITNMSEEQLKRSWVSYKMLIEFKKKYYHKDYGKLN